MLSGTPPITTNFGVFPETIPDYLNGRVGYRCNTLADFVGAGLLAKNLGVDVRFIREYAERFTMDRVALDYERWFEDLYQLYLSTKNPTVKGWHHL
jgi:glycosyltransferase involved in cell wall biosynthesis